MSISSHIEFSTFFGNVFVSELGRPCKPAATARGPGTNNVTCMIETSNTALIEAVQTPYAARVTLMLALVYGMPIGAALLRCTSLGAGAVG